MGDSAEAAGQPHPSPPAESTAEALRRGAGGKRSASTDPTNRADKAGDWRTMAGGDAEDVLRCMLAAGDKRAARLAEMSEADALAAVAKMQRTLGGWR